MQVKLYKKICDTLVSWTAKELFFVFLCTAMVVTVAISATTVRWVAGKSISTIQKEISASEIRMLARQVESTVDVIKGKLNSAKMDQSLVFQLRRSVVDDKRLVAALRENELLGSQSQLVVLNSQSSPILHYVGDQLPKLTDDQTGLHQSIVRLASEALLTSSRTVKTHLLESGAEAQVGFFI